MITFILLIVGVFGSLQPKPVTNCVRGVDAGCGAGEEPVIIIFD